MAVSRAAVMVPEAVVTGISSGSGAASTEVEQQPGEAEAGHEGGLLEDEESPVRRHLLTLQVAEEVDLWIPLGALGPHLGGGGARGEPGRARLRAVGEREVDGERQ